MSSAALASLSSLLLLRAEYLVPILLIGLLIGEPLARLLRFPLLRAKLGTLIATLRRKLNRPNRSIATRLYRGMVALAMLVIPAIALGLWLMQRAEWVQLLSAILFVALIGEIARPYRLLGYRRMARSGRITLQSDEAHYLFADTHGQLRYLILQTGERFTLLVGASLYYLAADLPGLLGYLALAATARYFHPALPDNRAFGWSAYGLFTLIDALPRFLAGLLLWLAAWCTPGSAPLSALRHFATAASQAHGWLAYLLGIALGGPIPSPAGERSLPWLGNGPARAEPAHYSRALTLTGAATLLWLLLLSATNILDIIDKYI